MIPWVNKVSILFYYSIKTSSKPDDNVCFKVQPMGENKISNMMESILADTILKSRGKKFTNHSACKIEERNVE